MVEPRDRKIWKNLTASLGLLFGITATASHAQPPAELDPPATLCHVSAGPLRGSRCDVGGVDPRTPKQRNGCGWRDCGCDMPQHYPYAPPSSGTYYFRPYSVTGLRLQQQAVRQWGGDPRNPYSNELFERVYRELEAEEIDLPPEEPPRPATPIQPRSEIRTPDEIDEDLTPLTPPDIRTPDEIDEDPSPLTPPDIRTPDEIDEDLTPLPPPEIRTPEEIEENLPPPPDIRTPEETKEELPTLPPPDNSGDVRNTKDSMAKREIIFDSLSDH